MAVRLEWSPQAREDLLDIYVSIGIENAAAAERYFDRIEARTSLLSDQPRLGVRRPDIRASVRILGRTGARAAYPQPRKISQRWLARRAGLSTCC